MLLFLKGYSTMTIFYVRNSLGNSSEDGSQLAPYKTISAAVTALGASMAGHTLRLWASDTFDERVGQGSQNLQGDGFTIERWYNSGNESSRPIVTRALRALTWTFDSTNNVWVSQALANIQHGGCITEDGVPMNWTSWTTNRATTCAAMPATDAATFDHSTLQYLIRPHDGTPADHVYAATAGAYSFNISNAGSWHIREIDLRYSAYGLYANAVRGGWTLDDVDVRFVGAGSQTVGGIPSGNGIGIGANTGAQGISYVRRCRMFDIFDTGYSPQIFNNNDICRDIEASDLEFWRCGLHGYELSISSTNATTVPNQLIENVHLRNSRAMLSGQGWSGNRYGSNGNGYAMLTNNSSVNAIIRNSTVTGSSAEDCLGRGVILYHTNGKVSALRNTVKRCGTGITLTSRTGFAANTVDHGAIGNTIEDCPLGIELGRNTSGVASVVRADNNIIKTCAVGIRNISRTGDVAYARNNVLIGNTTAIHDNGAGGNFTKATNVLQGNTTAYNNSVTGNDIALASRPRFESDLGLEPSVFWSGTVVPQDLNDGTGFATAMYIGLPSSLSTGRLARQARPQPKSLAKALVGGRFTS